LLFVTKIISFQGCVWPDGRAVITHELLTTILETKALIMGYFRSTAATGVMMAKPQEQKMPVAYNAMVRQDRSDDTGCSG
jgi:predicted aconitase with swiveling domain